MQRPVSILDCSCCAHKMRMCPHRHQDQQLHSPWDTHTHTHRHQHRERERDKRTDRQTNRQTERQTDRQAGRQADRQAGRQKDIQTHRDIETQTQTQKHTHTHTQKHRTEQTLIDHKGTKTRARQNNTTQTKAQTPARTRSLTHSLTHALRTRSSRDKQASTQAPPLSSKQPSANLRLNGSGKAQEGTIHACARPYPDNSTTPSHNSCWMWATSALTVWASKCITASKCMTSFAGKAAGCLELRT